MRVGVVGGMNAIVDCGEHDANNATAAAAATDAVFDDRMVIVTTSSYYSHHLTYDDLMVVRKKGFAESARRHVSVWKRAAYRFYILISPLALSLVTLTPPSPSAPALFTLYAPRRRLLLISSFGLTAYCLALAG